MLCIKIGFRTVLLNEIKTLTNFDKRKKQTVAVKNENSKESFTQDNINPLFPGKIKLTDIEIKEREKKLKVLTEKWRLEILKKEEYEKKMFGFSKNSEILNGRLAMFFLVTGLLTEYWTKQNILVQIETIIRILGLI